MEDPRVGACLACLAAAQDAAAMEPRRVAAQMQEEVRPRAATARSCARLRTCTQHTRCLRRSCGRAATPLRRAPRPAP
jgi:hypothetical protein